VHKADNLPPSCAVVTKSEKRNFLEPSGLLRDGNETALPSWFYYKNKIARYTISKCNQKAFCTPRAKRRTCFYGLTHWCATLAQNRSLFHLIIGAPYCQFHLQSAKYTVLINLSPDYTLDLHRAENRHECLCAVQFSSAPNFISWEQKYRNETNMLSIHVIRFSNFEPIHRVSWTPAYVLRDQSQTSTSNFEICTAVTNRMADARTCEMGNYTSAS